MEQQVFQQLTKSEQSLLRELEETNFKTLLIKVGAIYQNDKAVHIALSAPDFENVVLNRGNIAGARFIVDLMQYAKKNKKA